MGKNKNVMIQAGVGQIGMAVALRESLLQEPAS